MGNMHNLLSKLIYIINNKILLCILLLVVSYLSFYKNILNGADEYFFRGFQHDSEALVLANAFKDQIGISHNFSYLGFASMTGANGINYVIQSYIFTEKTKEKVSDIPIVKYENKTEKADDCGIFVDKIHYRKLISAIGYQIVIGNESRFIKEVVIDGDLVKISYYGEALPQEENSKLSINYASFGKQYINTSEYTSQYGVQGKIVSFLFNKLNLSVKTIQEINVLIFSFVILGITYLFNRIFSKALAVCFFISIVFSPWIISFARNLYWIEFSWFLPALFGWSLYIRTKKKERLILYFCIYLSCWFKCLSGYEYFSSVLLLAAAPFFYSCLMSNTKNEFFKNLSLIIKIGLVGTLGFISAIIMHAYLRSGGDITDGLSTIWHQDVLRRTFGGNAKNFDPLVAASLEASHITVLKKYITEWHTEVIRIPILKILSFKELLILSITFVFLELSRGDLIESRKNATLLIVFCIPAISWYLLGKAHSYVHTHMNYVLWYMGGVAIMVYIIFKETVLHIKLYKTLHILNIKRLNH